MCVCVICACAWMHACFEPLYVCGCIYVEECGQAREGENVRVRQR